MTVKGPNAFRTISEAAAEVGAPAHVLRFWETRFSALRPMRRAGGRRLYRPADLDVLKAVHWLLRDRGHTIVEIHKLSRRALIGLSEEAGLQARSRQGTELTTTGPKGLRAALAFAIAAKRHLDRVLDPSRG